MSGRPARHSLAAAFRPAVVVPDRAAGLADVLPARPVKSVPTLPAPIEAGLAVVPDSHGRAGSGEWPEPTPQGDLGSQRLDRTQPSAYADPGRVRNVAVYLPMGLLDRFRRTARSREMTYSELLVEAAAAHLDGLVSGFAPVPVPVTAGMPVRTGRRTVEPGVQVQVRLDGHQVAWLDEQVARLGAPSRTSLVVALLSAHLGTAG